MPVFPNIGIRFANDATCLYTFCVCLLLLACNGCIRQSEQEVVVYAALDKEFSQPILRDFENSSGITVRAKYDVESNKTVGLANEILTHKSNQRADVFWNNEILHTLRLKKAGLLEVYFPPNAEDYPAIFRSADKDWLGFAARARVLIVNNQLVDQANRPSSVNDLIDPQWKNKCGMAKPFFGTTATHAAVLFEQNPEGAAKFFTKLAANAVIEGGNKQVAIKVARGELAFGITDTDDAIIEIEKGNPVSIVFPDQGENDPGTLLIPNTLSIIKDGKNTDNARQLVEYLLQPEIEQRLRDGASAQIPLNKNLPMKSRAYEEPEALKVMEVDFQAAADRWDTTVGELKKIFE